MKKFALLAVCAAGFFLIAAPIYMNQDFHNVLINGKTFTRAALVNGKWAVALDDFSRAVGGNGVTLEPALKLNGNSLSANIRAESQDDKHKSEVKVETTAPSSEAKFHTNAIIAIRKAGGISNNVFMANGKAWVPLADIARAFGGTFTAPAGNLRPTESLSLNFANKPDAILGFTGGIHP